MADESITRRSGRQRTAGRNTEQASQSEHQDMDAITTKDGGSLLSADHPRLPEDIQNKIGQQLRAVYNRIAEEPVPDHLLKLLKRLDEKE